jgi:2-oxoglutarate dehydrogenase E1 component
MYLKFINKDKDLPESWQNYFESIGEELNIIAKEINGPSWGPSKSKVDIDELQRKIDQKENNLENGNIDGSEKFNYQLLADSNKDSISAVSLVRAYRLRGHLLANLDPLNMRESDYLDELHPEFYGFKKENYNKKIFLNGVINRKYAKYSTEDICPIKTQGASGAQAPIQVKIKKSATSSQYRNLAIGLNW